MLTIDSHCHPSPSWFEPVEILLLHMSMNHVDGAVLVQRRDEHDNSYLLECAHRFPNRFSVVGSVDSAGEGAPAELERWAAAGISGLRLLAVERSPGDDPLALWRKAMELGLPMSCSGSTEVFASDNFRALIAELPDLAIVIEHMAVHTDARGHPEPPYTEYRKVLGLASLPNVFMKVTGFGEYMPRPTAATLRPFDLANVPPYLDMAIEAFGPQRLMFGSGFPPVSGREGYGNAIRYVREYLTRRSVADREAILGGTAASLFPLIGRQH